MWDNAHCLINMKITFLTYLNINYPGGGQRVIYPLAMKLIQKGHAIKVISTKDGEATTDVRTSLLDIGVQLSEIETIQHTTLPLEPKTLVSAFRESDVVYFEYWAGGMEIAALACSWYTGVPVVSGHFGHLTNAKVESHLAYRVLGRLLGPRNIRIGKFLSRHHVLCKQDYRDLIKWVDPKRVAYLPLGVQNSFFKKQEKFGTFTLFLMSRLVAEKGILLLPKIIRRIESVIPKFHIFIAGSGKLEYFVRELALIDSRVSYLGEVSESTKRDMLAQSHVFIAPSSFESFMLTGIEAMSSFTPVVVFDIPGPTDYVQDGYNGFVANDEDDFASKILELYNIWRNDEASYDTLMTNCRRTALRYDWDRHIIPAFEDLIKGD